ncbi:hypothetical protein [Psychroserpens sp. SPM9]|uniref:hypothetical protein n=1 Tax=Psychroserpens sp. SPM9 TaxID=2975598 RepID=UPI0021A61EF1|nr:hypothetical protein [Psychroserpens sp. SPM9]MDG5492297.1 hypothetical protein [Psychroserpens sp. SPM9]
MKKILYILLLLFFMTCNNNEAMKTESTDIEMVLDTEDDFDKIISSPETLSIQKLEEYVDLIKIKQEHPEFEADINLQLSNFTLDNASVLNYPEGFSIANIQVAKKPKALTNNIQTLKLTFTVTTPSETFKDSIGAVIKSEPIQLDGKTQISRAITFLRLLE